MNGPCPGCGVGEGGYHLGASPYIVWYPSGPLCPILAEKIKRHQIKEK